MQVSKQEYAKMVSKTAPPSPLIKDMVAAFLVGGFICALGQVLLIGYEMSSLDDQSAKTMVSVTLIFLSALLTAFGIFDKIAKFSGAGTLVPITGFANSVVSPAIEYKAEGFVLGVGAKMFTIAGPVIVYGVSASVVYGIIYWLCTLM